jgi:hypothetical protein
MGQSKRVSRDEINGTARSILIFVSFDMIEKTIVVRSLPAGIGQETLRPLFKKFGKIDKLDVLADGSAYVVEE